MRDDLSFTNDINEGGPKEEAIKQSVKEDFTRLFFFFFVCGF